MNRAYLSLGSNLGDRLGYLAEAVRRLEVPGTRLLRVSSLYETAPQGMVEQPAFINLCVEIETSRDPLSLLDQLQEVEQALGRVRIERWGPRIIDIDLLLYGAEHLKTDELEIPHPRMAVRAFVLIPLLELVPDLTGGPHGETSLRQSLATLPNQGVTRLMGAETFLQRVRGVQ